MTINEELSRENEKLMIKNSKVIELNKSLQNLLCCIDIPIVLLDSNKRIKYFSPMAAKLLSIIPTDIGEPISIVQHKLPEVDLDRIINNVIKSKTSVEKEIQDIEDTWYKFIVKPCKTDKHELHHDKTQDVVLVLFNIDDLKRANKTIKKTQDVVLSFINNAPDPMLVIDSQLKIQRANDAFYKSYQFTPKDTEGKNIKNIARELWDCPELIKNLETVSSKNITVEPEIEHQLPNSDKFFQFNLVPVNLSNSSKDVLLSIRDITCYRQKEYKKLYEKLSLALDAGQIGAWEYDTKLGTFFWDKRIEEIWGINNDTFKGTYEEWIAKIHPEDKSKVDSKFQTFIKQGGKFDVELRILHDRGDIHWIHIKALKLQNQDPNVIGATWDITDETLLAQELLSEQKKLLLSLKERDQINQELESFAYIVSHDLKAPLRGIECLTKWIKKDSKNKLSDESKENFHLLLNRTKRMSDLIEGILAYTRAGRVDNENSEVSVKKLIDEIIDSLNVPKTLKIDYSDNLPTFKTAKVPLMQVFTNLISNGIKYGNPKGKIEIGVKEADDFYEFYVADDGEGINPKHHKKIFNMFQTLQSKDKFDSTGIGLSIVKKIVELNHGKVSVKSEKGKGATFRFTWPK